MVALTLFVKSRSH